ncbi:PIR protein [Plasmodium vivax]|nr:PIR protein [Plasmodium vivax]
MLRRGYGISSFSNEMLKRHRENACLNEYFKVKSEIEQKIGQLNKGGHSHFCRKCRALKEHIIAENERFNNCQLRNSKQLKLIDDDDNIKSFVEECIDNPTCFINRTRSSKKIAAPARASAGKDKQQSGGDSKTSKHGGSPIKSLPRKDQNPTDRNVLTKAKPIAHNTDGINASHNSGEAQEEVSQQRANAPASTSGRRKTQEQTLSQSVHHPVSGTDTHPSGSIEGTPNGEDHLSKPNKKIDLRVSTSQSNSPSGQIAKGHGVKNQERDGTAAVTEIFDTGAHAVKGVGTDACSEIIGGKETCDEKAVIKDSSHVTSYDASVNLDIIFDEYACSEDDFGELFVSETLSNEAPDRETSSSMAIGKEPPGIVPHTAVLNPSIDGDIEPTFLPQDQKFNVPQGVSEINKCQMIGDLVSTDGCVHSNSVPIFESSPLKEMCSEEQKNQDQLLSGQNSHQRDQLNQQVSEQQEGQLYSEQGSSLQVEGRSGGGKDLFIHINLYTFDNLCITHTEITNSIIYTFNYSYYSEATKLQAKEDLNDPDPTNIMSWIKTYKNYIISGLLPLVIFLLLFLLIKCTPMGTLFTKKKGRKRKEMNEKLQRVLSEPSATRESRIPFSYSAFEYSS